MNDSRANNRKISTLLLIALLISIGFNLYQMRSQSQTVIMYDTKIDTMIDVRIALERELSAVEMELEKYRGISGNLDSLLNDANAVIAKQERKIRALLANEKDSKKLNEKLKSELAELRSLREDYLERIDQLITENNLLKAQNDQLNTSVQQLNEDKRNLQSKVNTASMLKAEYIKVSSFRKKSSGKFAETALARRTNKIDVCFTVLDNKVTPSGEKMVYVVITEPTGKVLAGYTKTDFLDDTQYNVSASASAQIKYDGDKQNVCLSYENDVRILTSGTYTIDIYIDNTLVANTAYVLK
jgi:vacuolar-type H+-ATPase subunit I/STV1